MARKRVKRKIGSSWTAMRKINGKRRKVRITKKGKNKFKVRIISKKKRRKKRTTRKRKTTRRTKRRKR